MKRYISLFLMLTLLLGTMVLPSYAVSNEKKTETEIVYVEGVGTVEIETITTVFSGAARSSTVIGEKTKNYKADGTLIATITLKATFGYDGSSAWVNSASVAKSTSNGWTYGGQNIDKDGGTATLTAALSHSKYADIPVEITMTCSPTGKIS